MLEFSRVTQLANLPEPLLAYRVHATQTSQVLAARCQASANETRRRQLLDRGFALTDDQWAQYFAVLDRATRPHTAADLRALLATMCASPPECPAGSLPARGGLCAVCRSLARRRGGHRAARLATPGRRCWPPNHFRTRWDWPVG